MIEGKIYSQETILVHFAKLNITSVCTNNYSVKFGWLNSSYGTQFRPELVDWKQPRLWQECSLRPTNYFITSHKILTRKSNLTYCNTLINAEYKDKMKQWEPLHNKLQKNDKIFNKKKENGT